MSEVAQTAPTMDTAVDTTVSSQPVAENIQGSVLDIQGNPFENQPVPEPSWRDVLPDELKSLAFVNRYNSLEDLVTGHHNLQKLVGRKAGEIAPEEILAAMTPEQIAEYHASRGVPEAPEMYKAEEHIPDYLRGNPIVNEGLTEAKKMAHKFGVSEEMFNEFVKLEIDLHKKATTNVIQQNLQALSSKYGMNLEHANQLATHAAYKLGGNEAVQQLAASGLVSNPLVFDMLYKAGQMMKGDRFPVQQAQGTVTSSNSPQAIKEKISSLYNDKEFYTKLTQNHPEARQTINSLYAQLDKLEPRR